MKNHQMVLLFLSICCIYTTNPALKKNNQEDPSKRLRHLSDQDDNDYTHMTLQKRNDALLHIARTSPFNEAAAQNVLIAGASKDTVVWPLVNDALTNKKHLAQLKVIKMLGASLEQPDAQGYTPLMQAIKQGNTLVTAALLALGANANAQNKQAVQISLQTHMYGDADEAPEPRSAQYLTPLMVAALYPTDDEKITNLLLRYDANPFSKSGEEKTALDYAKEQGIITENPTKTVLQDLEYSLQFINPKEDIHPQQIQPSGYLQLSGFKQLVLDLKQQLYTAMIQEDLGYVHAFFDNNLATLQNIVKDNDQRASFNTLIMKDGKNPLTFAMTSPTSPDHQIDVLEHLINQNIFDSNVKNVDGSTALHTAVRLGNEDFVLLLLTDPYINRNLQNKEGKTALQIAIQNDLLSIACDILNPENEVEQDLFLNIQDQEGKTALHYAAQNENLDLIEELVTKGAKIDIEDRTGHTPLYYATTDTAITLLNSQPIDSTQRVIDEATVQRSKDISKSVQFLNTKKRG